MRALTEQWGLLLLSVTCVGAGLWATTQRFPERTAVLFLGSLWALGMTAQRWSSLNELDAARHLALARKAPDAGSLFHHAREAWRLGLVGGRTQADALVVMASRYANEARGDEARALLRAIPAGFTPPVSIAADALLLQGASAEALALIDGAPAPLAAHCAHLRVRALLQLHQLAAAREFLSEPGREVCFEAFHEAQWMLLNEGELEAAIAVGERGQAREERPLGARLLAESYGRAGCADDEARWHSKAASLGYLDSMRSDFLEVMDAVRLGPPLAVRRDRPSALPRDPALAGFGESRAEFIGHWLLVTTLAFVVARITVTLPILVWDSRTTTLPAGLMVFEALVLGGLAAGPQYFFLRRSLAGAGWWVAVSMLGAVAGHFGSLSAGRLSVLLLKFLGIGEESMGPFIILDLRLCVALALQAVVLRRWFPRTGAWVLVTAISLGVANGAGWMIWQAVLSVVGRPLATSLFFVNAGLHGLLEGLVVGGATGWLLHGWAAARKTRLPETTMWMSER